MTKKLYQVDASRTGTQSFLVYAEDADEARIDAESLVDGDEWEDTYPYIDVWLAKQTEPGEQAWSGGPDGKWVKVQ